MGPDPGKVVATGEGAERGGDPAGPTCLLLPGLDGTGALLRPVADRLRARGRTTRIVNYPTRTPLSLDALAGRVLADLPGGRFALVGESFSGPVALRIARARPEGLIALVLVASFVEPILRGPFAWAAQVAVSLPPPGFGLRTVLTGWDAEGADVRALQASIGAVTGRVFRARVRELSRLDARQDLAELKVPALYLRGVRDRLVPAVTARRLQHLLPTLEVVDLPTPHLVLQRAPERAAEVIDDFLARVEL